jgi:hypothetical protein
METQIKQCATCKLDKQLAEFAPTKQQLKFGVKSVCRQCDKEYKRKWVEANPVRQRDQVNGWKASNRDKVRGWNREYSARIRKEKPEQWAMYERRARLKREYGVTPEWFEVKYKEQQGLCAICGLVPTGKGLCIDHCHKTGVARELLCTQCNTTLHKMELEIEWVRKAEAYLQRHDEESNPVARYTYEAVRH